MTLAGKDNLKWSNALKRASPTPRRLVNPKRLSWSLHFDLVMPFFETSESFVH